MDTPHDIVKNSTNVVRFQVTEYRGKLYADVRIYYRDTVTDEVKPTKKGLCIDPAIWEEFVRGIEVLGEELQERGLLEDQEGSFGKYNAV